MKKLWFESLIITVFVFFMLWGGAKVTDLKIFNAFDPIGQALRDFELSDYAFSNLRPDPLVDERIILVNIGRLPRRDIAEQIRILSEFKPRVIAFDGFFNCEGGLRDSINCPALLDTLGNLLLSNAIQEAGNVILGSKLLQTDSLSQFDIDVYDSIEISDPMFNDYALTGFTSLPTNATYQEDVKVCRSIFPKRNVGGKEELYFGVQIAMQYDSVKARKFLARNKEEELINFRGNIEVMQLRIQSEKNDETAATNFKTMFYVVDADQLLRREILPEMFKDHIVIMGYLGDYLGDAAWEDKFFTPLNKKVAGRANPDMFGPVVHANAVAMILNEDYVDALPDWAQYVVAFVVCLLTVALFIFINEKLPDWFDALSVVIQLVEVIIISFLVIYAFAEWSYKLELAVAIGVSALVGPCYDIYKSVQNEVTKRLTKRRERALIS
ncbi:MAG: CHASE2 domain-containing protein [Cyclobacteriaceae bacterium]|nr:CHASE2 domain-containing protein [Cyclobacteriaceae bacterium]